MKPIPFIKQHLQIPAKILDLGAGDFSVVEKLKVLGYAAEGVDLKTGVDLNDLYLSKNAPYDMVLSCFVLHFLDKKENLIRSAYDNLKPGGTFFFQDIERNEFADERWLTKEEMEGMIRSGGFEVIESDKEDYYDDKPGHMHWHKIVTIHAKKK